MATALLTAVAVHWYYLPNNNNNNNNNNNKQQKGTTKMKNITPLTGHTSETTAYIVDDYPYGFRLRCKIRYWIESHPNHGFRFCSQTTNPKLNYEHWNKPKKSTYSYVCEGLYLDENNHVQACALTEYSDLASSLKFKDQFYDCLNSDAQKSLDRWIDLKRIYEEMRDAGEIQIRIQSSDPIPLMDLVNK